MAFPVGARGTDHSDGKWAWPEKGGDNAKAVTEKISQSRESRKGEKYTQNNAILIVLCIC